MNAENHEQGFKPSPGRIGAYRAPGGPGVRVDSHLEANYEVPPFYDAMLAKLICWGRDREEARRRMARALGEFQIEGIHTTIPFHQALIARPEFVSGKFNTRFVHDVLGY